MTPQEIIDHYNLQPNTEEGGYFANTYAAAITVPNSDLPGFPPVNDQRTICSAIYYFLQGADFSAMHKVTGDMLYHFYSGDPVEMLLLYPEGAPQKSETCIFSNNLNLGGQPMKCIPGGTWLGSRLLPKGQYAFMGVSMAPGFNPADYSIGKRKALLEQYPEQKDLIMELTRS